MPALSHLTSKAQTDDWESINNHEADAEHWTYWVMSVIRHSSSQRWQDQLSNWWTLTQRQSISTLRDCLFKWSTQIFICIMLIFLFIVCIAVIRSAMIRIRDSEEKASDISIVRVKLIRLTSLNLSKLAVKKFYQMKTSICCHQSCQLASLRTHPMLLSDCWQSTAEKSLWQKWQWKIYRKQLVSCRNKHQVKYDREEWNSQCRK